MHLAVANVHLPELTKKMLLNDVYFPTPLKEHVSNSRHLRHAKQLKKNSANTKVMESPYFFLLILFIMGYAWHSLLMRFRKKEE